MFETNCQRCNDTIEYRTFRPKWCRNCYPIVKLEKTKEWQKNNPEKESARKQKWKEENREKSREIWRRYIKTEKGMATRKRNRSTEAYRLFVNFHSAKRRAMKRNVIHSFTQEEWNNKLNTTKGICPMCKNDLGIENLTLDHIFPISKADEGRIYTIDDVQPICIRCNTKKNDKVMI